MSVKSAIITGVTGQDGAYLAKQLLDDNYSVIGIHQSGRENLWRLDSLRVTDDSKFTLEWIDFSDFSIVSELVQTIEPNQIYNLAAVSSIFEANEDPLTTTKINSFLPIAFLDAIRGSDIETRFFQASSAEIFGDNRNLIQTESTLLAPAGPYAVSKAYAHRMVEHYRDHFGLFACNGIFYNHESPLRGEKFLSKKIITAFVQIASGVREFIEVGNLDAKRDWGYAPEYVSAMRNILSHNQPDTFILCTGSQYSVREFIDIVAKELNIHIRWHGSGMEEKGINKESGEVIVKIHSDYYRPEAHDIRTGDASKASRELNWKARTDLKELCQKLITYELKTKNY